MVSCCLIFHHIELDIDWWTLSVIFSTILLATGLVNIGIISMIFFTLDATSNFALRFDLQRYASAPVRAALRKGSISLTFSVAGCHARLLPLKKVT